MTQRRRKRRSFGRRDERRCSERQAPVTGRKGANQAAATEAAPLSAGLELGNSARQAALSV